MSLLAVRHSRLMVRGGRVLHPVEAPGLYDLIRELAERAGLRQMPRVVYVPSPSLTALTTGHGSQAVVVVTDGLLRRLDREELRGVLAHEVSHLANNDIGLMTLGGMFLQMTSMLSRIGFFLLLLNIPLMIAMGYHMPWGALALLSLAPVFSYLLILVLSRTREYEADLDSARLCGSPDGLIRALVKIEHSTMSFWERLFNVQIRDSLTPGFMRTHPPTAERIRRLQQLSAAGHGAHPYGVVQSRGGWPSMQNDYGLR
jgi:heat shock protein HtpX